MSQPGVDSTKDHATGLGPIRRLWSLGQGDTFRARLVRGGAGSLAVKAANIGLGFILAVMLARTLGAEGYGIYAFAMALVSVLAIPAQVGIPQVVVRETARADARADWGLMCGLWRWGTRTVLLFSAAVLILGLGVLYAVNPELEPARASTLALAFLLVPFLALGKLRGAALRGLRRVVWGQVPDMVLRPGLLVLAVILAGALGPGSGFTPDSAMELNVGAAAIAFFVGAWLLWIARPPGVRAKPPIKAEPAYWRRAALPLALTGGLQLLNSQTDIVLLGLFRESDEVGIYRVAVQGASLVTFGLMAVNQVIAPHISHLYAQRDMARLQRLVTQSARVVLLVAMVPAIVFMAFGDVLLGTIFGERFGAGHTAIGLLALGQLVNAGVGSVGVLLNMTGHERKSLQGIATAAITNVVLNLILVPPFGMHGAAVSTAISMVIWNALLLQLAKKHLNIDSSPFRF